MDTNVSTFNIYINDPAHVEENVSSYPNKDILLLVEVFCDFSAKKTILNSYDYLKSVEVWFLPMFTVKTYVQIYAHTVSGAYF